MNEQLQKKVNFAIKLLQSAEKMAAQVGQPLEIAYSGGKDSDVILELAKMAEVNYKAIYKNTTIDPPGTIAHAKAQGAEILRPKISFREILAEHGFPSRKRRFCCQFLKEYKVLDYAVVGVRRSESWKRAERYKEPELCRVYNKKEKTRQYFPILEWTDKDVADFIAERGIKCHSLYYDEQGEFHPERRLGCMACPMKYRPKRIADFKAHPNLVKMYIREGQRHLDTHPDNKKHQYFADVYENFAFDLFCDNMQDFRNKFGANMFGGRTDCKQFLSDYFGITL